MTKECGKCCQTKPIGQFARQAASRDGYHSICKTCVNKSRPKQNSSGRSVVNRAIKKGDLAIVKELIEGQPKYAKRALLQAAQYGKLAIVEFLLALNYEINLNEPLLAAVSLHATIKTTGEHRLVAKKLLANGADVNARGGWNCDTALLAATAGGFSDIVDMLLAHDAKVDIYAAAALGEVSRLEGFLASEPSLASQPDLNGMFPLHTCARSRLGVTDSERAERLRCIVERLLAAGASIEMRDLPIDGKVASFQRTPLGWATVAGNRSVASFLLEQGADVNGAQLGSAIRRSPQMAEELLTYGADVNRQDPEHGATLLHSAANFPHPEIVAWLIKHGADVNVKMDDGRTPLHRAAERNTGPRVCSMLLEANAKINAKDATGKTPLSYAVEKNKWKVADFLRANGAT
ncbi:MAG: ankyrin repeat domain-containing protein [Candidatus Poribacteria bacterium]|nr:ankyrin repeat domain-containing protein [Candidatus Poribacteria bacterium]